MSNSNSAGRPFDARDEMRREGIRDAILIVLNEAARSTGAKPTRTLPTIAKAALSRLDYDIAHATTAPDPTDSYLAGMQDIAAALQAIARPDEP
jgi:hypothetical protein